MVEARSAATILLLREHQGELQVFMQQRSHDASFGGGAYVFPGGKVDPVDFEFPHEYLVFPQVGVNHVLLANSEVAQLVAAIRECFEEAGILLAYTEKGDLVDLREQSQSEKYLGLKKSAL